MRAFHSGFIFFVVGIANPHPSGEDFSHIRNPLFFPETERSLRRKKHLTHDAVCLEPPILRLGALLLGLDSSQAVNSGQMSSDQLTLVICCILGLHYTGILRIVINRFFSDPYEPIRVSWIVIRVF